MVEYVDGADYCVVVKKDRTMKIKIPIKVRGTDKVECWVSRCIKIKDQIVSESIPHTVMGVVVNPKDRVEVFSEHKSPKGTERRVHFIR